MFAINVQFSAGHRSAGRDADHESGDLEIGAGLGLLLPVWATGAFMGGAFDDVKAARAGEGDWGRAGAA